MGKNNKTNKKTMRGIWEIKQKKKKKRVTGGYRICIVL
jgi:hypothetical protein